MNSIYIHIDEQLKNNEMQTLRQELLSVPHVTNVELSTANPHDLMIEFEERHNIPMVIQKRLHDRGLHSDIMSG